MKGALSLLLLTSACIAVTPLPILSGVLSAVGDLANAVKSLFEDLPSLCKMRVLNDISATIIDLVNNPRYSEIRSRWTGGDFLKLSDALARMTKFLTESRDSSGDLRIVKLSNCDSIITDTANSIVCLRNSVKLISSGGTMENDSVTLLDGLTTLVTVLYSLADVLKTTHGSGAVVFCTTLGVAGIINGLSKTSSACQRLGEVDPVYPFASLAEALSALVDALNKGSQ